MQKFIGIGFVIQKSRRSHLFEMIEAASRKSKSNTNLSEVTGDCESCGYVIYGRMVITMGIQDEVRNKSIKDLELPKAEQHRTQSDIRIAADIQRSRLQDN